MRRTTIIYILAVLTIISAGTATQGLIVEKRWADDIIYFDIQSNSIVHVKMVTTVHPAFNGWSWVRDSFVANDKSRRITNYRSYDYATDQPLEVEAVRDGEYMHYLISFKDTKYTDYTFVSEFDLEYTDNMAFPENSGIFSWNWGSPEFQRPQCIYVTLPEGSEMGQINGVANYEKIVENGRVVMFFENSPGPDEYFGWDVYYTLP